jgi:hypothetical protein
VFQDGSPLGVTPLDLSMNEGSTLSLLLRKKGFAEHTLEVRAEDRARVIALRPLAEAKTDKADKPSKTGWVARPKREHPSRAPKVQSTIPTVAPPNAGKSSPYERF